MDRFESVSDIGKGSSDDDTHCVVHVGLPHLLLDVDRYQSVVRYWFHRFK